LADTYVLTLSDPCPLTGQACEVAQALLDALAATLNGAGIALGTDFSIAGHVETRVCGCVCRLHWSGSYRDITVGAAVLGRGPALQAERVSVWLA
jgi:hypothetical protein